MSVLFQHRWKTHTLDLPLCLITSYSMATSKKKSMRLNFHIYIDLNYFGPRGLNKLQSGSRGVALFFSSFTGIWFNWYRGVLQKREGKNSLGHLAEDLTCSCSPGEKETERGRDGERKKPAFPHSPGWVF